jgi:hypothetical protein
MPSKGVEQVNESREHAAVRQSEHVVIRIPLTVKRRAGRNEIIAAQPPNSAPRASQPGTNPLVVAIARAHRWKELIERGRFGSATEIAAAQGVDPSYVARLLRLTLLAPDIVQSILDGAEPDGASLAKLHRMPVAWEEQRRRLGLTSVER